MPELSTRQQKISLQIVMNINCLKNKIAKINTR